MNIQLNSDQQAALEAVQRGENIFLTGPAGSGKSTLVAAIVRWAIANRKVCDVTAMTGCAALLLGVKAKTLHSWAAIGLGRGTAEQLATDILKSTYAKKRWKRADILIIDEISMMSPELFEKLNSVGKRVRGGTKPWGGLQLILCGDFYQLPPVVREPVAAVGKYAFDAPAWKAANLTPVLLTRIERQTDHVFQTLLNEARVGQLSDTSIQILKSRQGLNWKEQQIRPTLLFSRNADVDSINAANLSALGKPLRTYDAHTVLEPPEDDPAMEIPKGDLLERLVTRMDADSSYVSRLELCEGCQVMLVYNMDMEKGLVNGSRGVIVGFRADGAPFVQFLRGDPVAIPYNDWTCNDCPALKRRQLPLRVAYAVTIHKSQGATLDCALVDIGTSTFECGQAYVALSRVRDLESLYVWNFNPARVMADRRVVEFYQSLTPSAELPEAVPEPPAVVSDPPVAVPEPHVAVPEPPVAEITADMEHVARAERLKKSKASRKKEDIAKPKAPRKKKESVLEVTETTEAPELPTSPNVLKPEKKPRAPRKKKESVLEVTETMEVPELPTSPNVPKPEKKPRAPRKKKEENVLEVTETMA